MDKKSLKYILIKSNYFNYFNLFDKFIYNDNIIPKLTIDNLKEIVFKI